MTASTETATPAAPRKAKLFKSRKELIVLAVSVVVFAFVIHRMYLSKRMAAAPQVAELNEAARNPVLPAAGQTADAQAPSTSDIIVMLDSEERDNLAGAAAPAEPARDPFSMGEPMREVVYKAPTETKPVQTAPNEIVTLTDQNARELLGKIPGAKDAAEKGLRLEAIMNTGSWKGAVINGKVVAQGQTILGFSLSEVLDDNVILQFGTHRVRLLIHQPAADE